MILNRDPGRRTRRRCRARLRRGTGRRPRGLRMCPDAEEAADVPAYAARQDQTHLREAGRQSPSVRRPGHRPSPSLTPCARPGPQPAMPSLPACGPCGPDAVPAEATRGRRCAAGPRSSPSQREPLAGGRAWRLRHQREVAAVVGDRGLYLVCVIERGSNLPKNLTGPVQLPRDLMGGGSSCPLIAADPCPLPDRVVMETCELV